MSRSDGSLLSSPELALPRFVICNKKYIKSSSLPPSVSKFYLAFGSFCVYVLMTSRSISFSFSKVLHLFSNSSKRACLSLSAFSKEFMYAFFLSLACVVGVTTTKGCLAPSQRFETARPSRGGGRDSRRPTPLG